ncbi:MAG: hypothetical protein JW776_14275 [Candidatus Lokiarchaeota archaeon]|nr:hypothetical protein [Candidatus Lokiarchaeota archaeon]
MKRKQYTSYALILLFFGQILFVTVTLHPNLNSTTFDSVGSDGNSLFSNDIPPLVPSASDTASTWWNESYTHRLLVSIQEPNIYQRTNEPVEVYLEFKDGTHLINSTRLLKYSLGTWTLTSFQLSNVTDDGTYIQSFTITFLVTINLNAAIDYYVYYSDDPGISVYSPISSLVTAYDGTTVNVDNGHYEIEFAEDSAIYNFEYKDVNYHTENSFMPLSTVLELGSTTYTTDSRGFITDWLIVGPFTEPSTWTEYASVTNTAHLDLTKDYVDGDYATGGNATIGLDPTKQWEIHNDADYRIDFNAIYGGDRRTAYAMVYVYAPSDFVDIYLKVAADDGVGVIMDHEYPRLMYHHTLNSLGSRDRWVSAPFNMTQGWHSFIVFCEEAGGDWSFTLRFSTDNVLRYFTDGTNAITNITLSLIPQSVISNVALIQSGPIYSQFELTWTPSQDMEVTDVVTFYEKLNMWKCERTFYWEQYHVSPDNSSFSAINTYYTATNFDEYLYDNQRTFGLTNQITSHDYTLIRDFDGGNRLTTIGLFLTELEAGNAYIQLDEINWTSFYIPGSPSLVNIVPGNETNLDNNDGPHPSDYTITMTFWEFLDDDIGSIDDYVGALAYVDGVYNSLMNPLSVSMGTEEDLFFNLEITCLDHDGYFASGVNISLVNTSDPGVWDNPESPNALSDENGKVYFERLKESDYTVNVTYEAFGKGPIELKTVDITPLNSSRSITIDELGLTRLDLNLQSTGVHPESIIGAKVTFYTNDSVSSEVVGDIFSDSSGIASFYWLNQSPSVLNYTFEVTFLGDLKQINVTGIFEDNHTTPLENYTSLVAKVQIQDFSTSLLMESGLTMTSYTWGESFDLDVYYFYQVSDVPYAISGATVTYTIPGYIIDGPLSPDGPDGYYGITIDSQALGLPGDTPLNIYVTATRPGYTPIMNATLLTLKPVPLEILATTTDIEVNWGENITFSVQLNDTYYNQLITDGTVNYGIAKRPSIAGTLTPVGNYYELNINSSLFGNTGSYILNLRGERDDYTTPTIDIDLKIRDIYTELNQTIFLQKTFDIYVTTSHSYFFTYTTGSGLGITDADTLDWELQQFDSQGSPISFTTGSLIETATPGVYSLKNFDTSILEVGTYSLVVRIGANNYIERQSAISISILQIPIELEEEISGAIFTAPKGDLINITLKINDPVYNTVISGATVTITYDGNTYNMIEIDSTGTYYHIVDTNAYQTLAFDKLFSAQISITVNENYTINPIPITIQIRPPLGPFNIPLIYWLIGGGVAVLALGAFAITKGIQYARIPWIIKQITATKKSIKKKSRFTQTKITRSMDELIADNAEGAFSLLGLSLKDKKIGKGKGKSKSSESYMDSEKLEGGNE